MRPYLKNLTATINRKGVLDIDTVKGCKYGMEKYPHGGCYGLCYANKTASFYGFDFRKSVVRDYVNYRNIEKTVKLHKLAWFRVGTMGDPSYDWDYTSYICEWLGKFKTPVIVTKHWENMSYSNVSALKKCGVVINTSISPMDTDSEIEHRLKTFNYLKDNGLKSVLRVVTAKFGSTDNGNKLKRVQNSILSNAPIIDNPLRIPKSDYRVKSGDILTQRHKDIGGGSTVSISSQGAFLGRCDICPDQCGVEFKNIYLGGCKMGENKDGMFAVEMDVPTTTQMEMFSNKVEFEYVKSVIGSGYEEAVAGLAIRDKVAYRAARKNMQIHSAIILKINDLFSGFFTFQVNHEAKEFCLLQSAMELDRKDKAIYSQMVEKIIDQNTYGYPMVMTVSTKHDLENPKVFEAIGFKTYLMLSGFAYMVYGDLADVRMKRLAHATMTNVWNSIKGDWLKMKKGWNEKIEASGEKYKIPNPKFASREGCWQGKNGFSNVVLTERTIENGKVKKKKGRSHNGNASVLDPVACECILRFFMPKNGKRVYNPFGGGVQFGYVAGSYGYEYIASEIRQNQCDCNNALCQDFDNAKWIKSDSATYDPDGMFDLVFSCPPYYRVERYFDYDDIIPDGEINSLPTYNVFRDTLFAGYKKAIEHLNDNCFFVVMTGDSRGPDGAYWGSESETELFFKDQGLFLYNKIIYLETAFTRLAQAKKTLNFRKFPKQEQKIIVGYKGDMQAIKDLYSPVGRL
jgi:hypothetical protein